MKNPFLFHWPLTLILRRDDPGLNDPDSGKFSTSAAAVLITKLDERLRSTVDESASTNDNDDDDDDVGINSHDDDDDDDDDDDED